LIEQYIILANIYKIADALEIEVPELFRAVDPVAESSFVAQYKALKAPANLRQPADREYAERVAANCRPSMWRANPEIGAVSCVYDSNGNMTQRTDANGNVTTISGYDGLNRPGAISYTVVSPAVATPTITYGCDVDFKGPLSSITNSVSSTTLTMPRTGGCRRRSRVRYRPMPPTAAVCW
jgi:hypothetical protein